MNGLLDFFNKGFDNSVGHLNSLKDSFANQPKMYDPHANAQALMGGQAMQYNQQPQSLIANTPQAGATNAGGNTGNTNIPIADPTYTQQSPYTEAIVNAPQSPWGSQQQQGLIGDGSNVNLGQTSETWGSGYNGTPTEGYTPIDTTGRPDYGVNSITPKYKTETDETDYSAQTTPFLDKFAWSENSNGAHLTGELKEWAAQDGNKFDPSMTEEERLLREQAKARLPWYLGGTGGK